MIYLKKCGIFSLTMLAFMTAASAIAKEAAAPQEIDEEQIARIQGILAQEEHVWLRSAHPLMGIETIRGGVIYWAGWVPDAELTPARLEALNTNSLKPNYIMIDSADILKQSTEVVRYPSSSDPEKQCAALIQVILSKTSRTEPAELEATLDYYRGLVPDYPLDADCVEQTPVPPKVNHLQTFATPNGVAIRTSNGPIMLDETLTCGQFSPFRRGAIQISSRSKVIAKRFTNTPLTIPIYERYAGQAFSSLEAGFTHRLTKEGLTRVQIMRSDRLTGEPGTITLTSYVVNDDQADQFCLVANLRQGESEWQQVSKVPRAGRVLVWAMKNGQENVWATRKETRLFAEKLATEIADTQQRTIDAVPASVPVPVLVLGALGALGALGGIGLNSRRNRSRRD